MAQLDLNQTYSPTGNTEKEDRAREIRGWNIEEAKQNARKEGIQFSVDHLAVITYLRKFYYDHGWPKSTHELTQILDNEFADKGGNKYLHKLFPDGPLKFACKCAGLPKPPTCL